MNKTFLDPFPALETSRLTLRALTMEDAPAMHRLRSDKEVMRLIDRPLTDSVESAEQLIESIFAAQDNGEAVMWAITLKGDSEMVGVICLVSIEEEHRRCHVGYLLDPKLHRQGLMSEALVRVVEFGFNQLDLHKIMASVNALNSRSIGLLERNGFVREAHYRQHYFWNGQFIDTIELACFSPSAKQAIESRLHNPISDVHA